VDAGEETVNNKWADMPETKRLKEHMQKRMKSARKEKECSYRNSTQELGWGLIESEDQMILAEMERLEKEEK
jgi:hypothetical protein